MYVGTYLDRRLNKLYVSERINGQRCTTEYPLVLEYYIEDENGYYEATNGKKLKKLTYDSALQTGSLMRQYRESGIKTYELGFNLTKHKAGTLISCSVYSNFTLTKSFSFVKKHSKKFI